MRITTVEYRRLVSQNYNNEAVGATATVDSDETPGQALEQLRNWVADHLAVPEVEPPQWNGPGAFTVEESPPSHSPWQRFRGWLSRRRRKPDDDLPF